VEQQLLNLPSVNNTNRKREKRGGTAVEKRWRRDLLLAAGLLAIAAVLALVWRPGELGAAVQVVLDGEEIARYPLAKDRRVVIGEEDYNILVIQDGGASVTEANCGDHTCVRTGEIRREGEKILCLPHRLLIQVIGGEAGDIDALSR